MRTVQLIVCAFLLGVFSLIGGQIAFAGGSPPTEISWSFDLAADYFAPGVCPFPIRVSLSGRAGTINLPGNRVIITAPGQHGVVTNLDDPSKTVTLNIPGVFHQTTEQNGDVVTVVTGRNMMGDPEAGFVLAIGTFSYIFDKDGKLIQPLTGKGQLIDICAMID
jgi:hypothetical protein